MMTRFFFRLGLVCLPVILGAPAYAATLLVPDEYPTIQAAIDVASPGDEIEVAPGTYSESIELVADVTVRGAGPGLSEIVATGSHCALISEITGVRIEGFTLRGASSVALMVEKGAQADIADCEIVDSGGGVQFYGSGGSIVRCTIRDLVGAEPYGVNCMNESSPTMASNIVIGAGFGMMSYYNSHPEVINNTFVDCATGVEFRAFFDGAISEPRIVNNIVAGCGVGLSSLNGAVADEITTNLMWDNGVDYSEIPAPPSDLQADPVFADPAGGDYHLTSASPAIDTGTDTSGLPGTDIDGDPCPLDGDEDGTAAPDIGADEYDPGGGQDDDDDAGDDDDDDDDDGAGDCACRVAGPDHSAGRIVLLLFAAGTLLRRLGR